jgi:lysophospholipase L1-like esterase
MPFDAISYALAKDPVPGILGFSRDAVPKWKRARARVEAGWSDAKILIVGDSTGIGWRGGAPTGSFHVGGKYNAPSARMSAIFNAAGLPSSYCSFFGSAGTPTGVPATLAELDPAISYTGSGWVVSTAGCLGGACLRNNTDTTSVFRWAPTTPFSALDLHFTGAATAAELTYSIDGGAPVSVVTGGSEEVRKVSLSVTLGLHTVEVKRVSGVASILGMEGYDAGKKQVRVINASVSGSSTDSWVTASNPWRPLPMISTLAPDLTFICLGINDMGDFPASLDDGVYVGRMQQLINAASASGDVVLCIPTPCAVSVLSAAVQAKLAGLITDLGRTNKTPVIDFRAPLVSYEAANPIGFYYDTRHPNALGYSPGGRLMSEVALRA